FVVSCKGAQAENNKNAKGSKNKKMKSLPKMVDIQVVKEENYVPFIEYVTKAVPVRSTQLSLEMRGKLVKFPVSLGQYVKKGTLLARVSSLGIWDQRNAAKAQIEQIKANLAQIKKDYARTKRLYKKNVVTQNQYDQAKLRLDTTKAQLNSARASYQQITSSISGTSLMAPFSGQIALKNGEVGTYMNVGVPLIKLVDLAKFKVETGVSELEINRLKVGDKVKAVPLIDQKQEYQGVIVSTSPSMSQGSGTFDVVIEFDNKSSSEADFIGQKIEGEGEFWKIKDGMTMKVKIEFEPVQGFFLEDEAIIDRNDKKYVFVVRDKTENSGMAKLVEIKQGKRFENRYRIDSGLQGGETVVLTSTRKMKNGSMIRFENEKTNKTKTTK
ncbi:MAG: efflux RND transporter periplasmic adaptor subunit, partial [Deltaproteobacteria bacterium]|nr:efflux RND transporter periplasmic adaptor subunit [Deltaproteobacteria bacterium]